MKWSSFIYLSLLMSSVVAEARTQPCVDHLLSRPQIEALTEARVGDYTVWTMTGVVDGLPRTLVLLGEAHNKNSENETLGHNVVDQFAVVGYESATGLEKFMAGRILKGIVAARDFLLKNVLGDKSSTADYVEERAETDQRYKAIHLEDGHEFTWKEKIGVSYMVSDVAYHMTTGFLGPAATLCTIPVGLYLGESDWARLGIISTVALVFMKRALGFMSEISGFRQWKLDFYDRTLCGSRDQVMVKNTLKGLQSDPSLRQMLVIVGRAHIPGVKTQLEQAGFQIRKPTDLYVETAVATSPAVPLPVAGAPVAVVPAAAPVDPAPVVETAPAANQGVDLDVPLELSSAPMDAMRPLPSFEAEESMK